MEPEMPPRHCLTVRKSVRYVSVRKGLLLLKRKKRAFEASAWALGRNTVSKMLADMF